MSQSPVDVGPRFAQRMKENNPQNTEKPVAHETPLAAAKQEQLAQVVSPDDKRAQTLWKTKVITSN